MSRTDFNFTAKIKSLSVISKVVMKRRDRLKR